MKTPTTKQLKQYITWIDKQKREPWPLYNDIRSAFITYGMLTDKQANYIKAIYFELKEIVASENMPMTMPEKYTSVDDAVTALFK
jgi:hypothetical protein